MPYLFLEGFDSVPSSDSATVTRNYFKGKDYVLIAGVEYPSYTIADLQPGRVRGGTSIKFPVYLDAAAQGCSYVGRFVPAGAGKAVLAYGWQFTGRAGTLANVRSPGVIQFDNDVNCGIIVALHPDRLVLGIRSNPGDGGAAASGNKVVRKDYNLSGFNQIAVEAIKATNRVRVYVNGLVVIDTTFTPFAAYSFRAIGFGGGDGSIDNNISNTDPTGAITIRGGTLSAGGGNWLDDIYASYDEDYAGDLVVRSLIDTGTTLSNTGTLTGAANVKDALATNDEDTSYVGLDDNTQAVKEQYIGNFLPTDKIVAVSAVVTARRTDSELIDVGAEIDVGAGNVGLTYSPLSLTHNGNFFLWNNNPTTGVPFTPAQVNNLAFRVSRRATP